MRNFILYFITCYLLCTPVSLNAQLKNSLDDAMQLNNMEWKDYISGTIQNTEIEEYTYNNSGLVNSAILSLWNANLQSYQLNSKITYNYANELISEKIYSAYDMGASAWKDTLKRNYIYNDDNTIGQLIVYMRASNDENWTPETKEEIQYDNNGNVTAIYFYIWDTEGDTWEYFEKDEYEYDSSNREINYTSWLWDFLFEEWLCYDKEEYIYDVVSPNVNDLTKYTYYEWNEFQDKWDYVFKDSSFYSLDGLKYAYVSLYWSKSTSSWINFSRELHDFNSEGKVISFAEYEWNENYLRWDYYDMEEYDYDSYGNVLLFVDYNKESQSNAWIKSLKEEYHYNYEYSLEQLIIPFSEPVINDVYFNSMMESIDAYSWNSAASLWDNSSVGLFSYSEFEPLDGAIFNKAKDFLLHPIPFINYIVVEGLINEDIVIYDLTGQVVLKTNVTAQYEVLNTESIHPGIYLIQAGSNKGEYVVKKVVKYE